MSSDQALQRKVTIENKIQRIITEFSNGKLNREQFQMIYMRYSEQLSLINYALVSGDMGALEMVTSGETVAIRSAYEGKAIGMYIYHNRTGTVVETLGTPEISPNQIAPILNDFTMLMEEERSVERRVQKVAPHQWLLLAAGHFTTIITQFRNAPSAMQITEMERLHQDFEKANQSALTRDHVEPARLAYPFVVFIEKRRKKTLL